MSPEGLVLKIERYPQRLTELKDTVYWEASCHVFLAQTVDWVTGISRALPFWLLVWPVAVVLMTFHELSTTVSDRGNPSERCPNLLECRAVTLTYRVKKIGHFRVDVCLLFKASRTFSDEN